MPAVSLHAAAWLLADVPSSVATVRKKKPGEGAYRCHRSHVPCPQDGKPSFFMPKVCLVQEQHNRIAQESVFPVALYPGTFKNDHMNFCSVQVDYQGMEIDLLRYRCMHSLAGRLHDSTPSVNVWTFVLWAWCGITK